ncbi:MAG: sigma-54-dependent Fis family transcriptional regulator, partial [Gemmatimonadetes bacterium]|nr:sigma-54-dependent Fis family transcriptional regulator [Gemmatimonadota bacterium]
DWPGNVRELENTLARAVVLCRSSTVTLQDISFADGPAEVRPESDGQTLADIERAHVQRVLSHAGGNKAEAARILGISRPKLYRMVDGYDLTVQ